jgi:hypothetical protein
MPLSEEQILLYSRQILLADVGGKGQERLGASCVAVRGDAVAAATASDYLAAGGTPLGSGGGELALGGGRVVYRRADGCPDCFTLNVRGASTDGAGVLAGAVGALAYQRAVWGWSDAVGVVELNAHGGFSAVPFARCERHA